MSKTNPNTGAIGMKTLYLCGAINGCTDSQCSDWQEFVMRELAGLYQFLNPMRRDYRGREDECSGEIVEGDTLDIAQCDAVIVAADVPSWGTGMEVRMAFHEMKKHVVVVCAKSSPSPWLKEHSSKIVKALPEAIDYLKGLAA